MSNIDLRIGDCLEEMKNIPDKSIDCIVTSPPYWKRIEYDANVNEELASESNELQKRIDKAIRILNSAKNHYDNDKTNWAIERTLRVLKGSDSNE